MPFQVVETVRLLHAVLVGSLLPVLFGLLRYPRPEDASRWGGRLRTAKVNAPTSDTPVYIQMGNA